MLTNIFPSPRLFFSAFWQRLKPVFLFYMAVEIILRCALFAREFADLDYHPTHIVFAFLTGFVFDTAVFLYIILPFNLFFIGMPRRWQGTQLDQAFSATAFFLITASVLFASVGEWFFWTEFQTRYNFIAVDYLIYTQEVIGNIRESYPVMPILSVIGLIAGGGAFWLYRSYRFAAQGQLKLLPRIAGFILLALLAVGSFRLLDSEKIHVSSNRYLNEIARNGIYELFSAYRHNELSYDKFYLTRPEQDNLRVIQQALHVKPGQDAANPLQHEIVASAKQEKYNLVLITVESLSADFLGVFGNPDHLTPHLDALAKQSLLFTNLYATGTRTVYGLSALTLSIPPIPGNSIVRRPGNDHLYSLGAVLRDQGYATKFIYGGFGYFDNMNNFFAQNGYQIIDRSDLKQDEIHFTNAWGVGDDDLYAKVITENDQAQHAGQPFFDMIMTTSNHRPYTYPDGKIDVPSHTGRNGAVKFTDFAIDEFLTRAKTHDWFKHTIFVIVADHTAGSAGKSELDPTKYHIPAFIYAPGIVKPGVIDALASQIDIAPTVLGLMRVSYHSQFYGKDVLQDPPQRAFVSNYQQLGYMTAQGLTVLKPVKQGLYYQRAADGSFLKNAPLPADALSTAVAYFQSAAQWKIWSKQLPAAPAGSAR